MRTSIIITVAFVTAASGAWHEPANLGPVVNTPFGDWYPVLTPDGAYMFFVSTRPGGYGNGDIWRSANVAGEWQTPVNCGAGVNTSGLDSGICLTSTGDKIYFASDGPGTIGDLDVWWAPVNAGQLGAKVHLGPPVNTVHRECCPVISADGQDLYFSSEKPGGVGGHDMYVSHRAGNDWGEPVLLGAPNSVYNDCPRWVSDDGRTLAFLSWRPIGEGGCDLWYSTKTGGSWGDAVNFGAPVNSGGNEFGPWFHCNHGQMHGMIYFGSTRQGGYGDFDIWRSVDDEFPAVPPSSVGRVKAIFK